MWSSPPRFSYKNDKAHSGKRPPVTNLGLAILTSEDLRYLSIVSENCAAWARYKWRNYRGIIQFCETSWLVAIK